MKSSSVCICGWTLPTDVKVEIEVEGIVKLDRWRVEYTCPNCGTGWEQLSPDSFAHRVQSERLLS